MDDRDEFAQAYWPSICRAAGSCFDFERDEVIAAELWHDRPRTAVYRFRLSETGDGGCYYLKVYKRPGEAAMAKAENDALLQLAQCFSSSGRLGVVRSVAHVPEIAGFVTEEFVGTNLYRYFRSVALRTATDSSLDRGAQMARQLADWVRVFQRATPDPDSRSYDVDVIVGDATRDLAQARSAGMVRRTTGDRVERQLEDLASKLSTTQAPLVAANVDAKLWNFLLSAGGELRGLDFVGFSRARPTLDMARLWIGMNWLKVFPQNSSRRIDRLQAAFVNQCKDSLAFERDEFRFHQLCVGIEVAAFYGGIRSDKYRANLRNTLFFPLIRRYYDRLLVGIIESRPMRGFI